MNIMQLYGFSYLFAHNYTNTVLSYKWTWRVTLPRSGRRRKFNMAKYVFYTQAVASLPRSCPVELIITPKLSGEGSY